MSFRCRSVLQLTIKHIPLVLLLLASDASAQGSCPEQPVTSKSKLVVETNAAVSAIKWVIGKLGFGVNVSKERDTVFSEHPDADQATVTVSAWSSICQLIVTNNDLSPQEKVESLIKAKRDLLESVDYQPVAQTDNGGARSEFNRARPVTASAAEWQAGDLDREFKPLLTAGRLEREMTQ